MAEPPIGPATVDGGVSRSLINAASHVHALMRERLWLQVIVGMALGIAVGAALDPARGLVAPAVSHAIGKWLAFPGALFLASVKFVVAPLVLASIIRGIAADGRGRDLGRVGGLSLGFFVASTVAAVAIGIMVTLAIHPGQYMDGAAVQRALGAAGQAPVAAGKAPFADLPDKILAILPRNPQHALAEGDMLQVVIVALVVGVALLNIPTDNATPILALLGGIQAVSMVIVKYVMRLAPIAVFGMMADLASRIGFEAVFGAAAYVATVLIGLGLLMALHLALTAMFGGRGARDFLANMREVMLMAFSTSSSAAVMPLTLKTAEERFHVPAAIARFVIPLGTTINMGGTALYQACATIFLAQVFGIDIGINGMIVIVVMATGAAIGAPGTPGISIVILATILETVGVPAAGIALILGVDRILDMCRTTVNVTGDMAATLIVQRLTRPPVDAAAQPGRPG